MPRSKNDKLQGTLTLLVLRMLDRRGPLHGYGLCELIRQTAEDLLQVEEGSLYPALHRMEQDQWISAEWVTSPKGRPAKMYSLTAAGRQQLAEEEESWTRLTQGVARILRYS